MTDVGSACSGRAHARSSPGPVLTRTLSMHSRLKLLPLLSRRESSPQWIAGLAALGLGATVATVLIGRALPPEAALASADNAHLYVPVRAMTAWSLAGGELPLWNPYVGCGVPFLANPMTQSVYPGNFVFLLFGAVAGIKVFYVAHTALLTYAFSSLARAFGASRRASIAGGLLFALAGPIVSLHWNPLWTAGLPWMLLALASTHLLVLGRVEVKRLLAIAACLALTVLAGGFELIVGYTFFAAADVAAATFLRRDRLAGSSLRGRVQRATMYYGALTVAGSAALALGAIQLLPALELFRESSRSCGVSMATAGLWSLPPLRLLEWLAPQLYLEPESGTHWGTLLLPNESYYSTPFLPGIYLGAPAVILAAIGVGRIRRGDRRLLLGTFVCTLVLAFGITTPIFELARNLVPGIALFRYPVKLVVFAVIPLALAATFGVDALLTKSDGARRPAAVAWIVTLLVALPLSFLVFAPDPFEAWLSDRLARTSFETHAAALVRAARSALLYGTILAAAVSALISLRRRFPASIGAGLILVVAIADLVIVGRDLVETAPTLGVVVRPPNVPAPAALADPTGEQRIHCVPPGPFRYFFQPYHAMQFGYRSTVDYGAMDLRGHSLLRDALGENDPRLLALASARLRLSVPLESPHIFEARIESVPTLPRARLVPFAAIAESDDDAIGYIASAAFRPEREVVLSDAPIELGRVNRSRTPKNEPAGSEDRCRLTIDERRHIRIDIETASEAFLVLSDTWYPGWETTVDGEQASCYRANLAFRAVRVPPGRHVVEFRYRPLSILWGIATSAVAASCLGAVFVIGAMRRRRERVERVATTRSAAIETPTLAPTP